jgi:spore germination protein YaaH
MTYEYAGVWSAPGPVAPHRQVRRAMEYAAALVPAEKLYLGLSFYGYDWNLSRPSANRAIGWPEGGAIAEAYHSEPLLDPIARSATWRYVARAGDELPSGAAAPRLRNEITQRNAPRCDVRPPPGPPARPTPEPPPPDTVEEHVVWVEEGWAAAARLEIATHLGINAGAWRLGQEDPAVWPAIREWRTPREDE